MQEVQLSSGVEPPLRFSAPRTAAVRECFVRSTVSVGSGRSLEALGECGRMTLGQITLLALFEAVGVVMSIRLWLKATKASLVRRIVWSILLLVPLLGPLMYGFISLDPSAHGEDVGDHSAGGGGTAGTTGHF